MGVKRIVPNFRSPDPAATRAFYEGVLGLELAQDLGAPRVRHRAPLTDEPWGVRRFFVREPTGRVLNILAHR